MCDEARAMDFNYSLAYMVSKAAIWVNKYDVWQRTKKWPGKEQAH
jgi:hypothetical protein